MNGAQQPSRLLKNVAQGNPTRQRGTDFSRNMASSPSLTRRVTFFKA
jgi:hypothetical protein